MALAHMFFLCLACLVFVVSLDATRRHRWPETRTNPRSMNGYSDPEYKAHSNNFEYETRALFHGPPKRFSAEDRYWSSKRATCPDPTMCMSKWGYCGTDAAHCGDGCQSGPCTSGSGNNNNPPPPSNNNNGGGGVTADQFKCAFPDIDDNLRNQRFSGYQASGFTPANNEEIACFFGHVSQETGGLSTFEESSKDQNAYQSCADWGPNSPSAVPGHYYYGRGALQISYPCNYKGAGDALHVDLLNNPEQVATDQTLAWKTGVWFYNAHNMGTPCQAGDFAASTRIINSGECGGGPLSNRQAQRVAKYEQIRGCFGLGAPSKPDRC